MEKGVVIGAVWIAPDWIALNRLWIALGKLMPWQAFCLQARPILLAYLNLDPNPLCKELNSRGTIERNEILMPQKSRQKIPFIKIVFGDTH